MIRRGALLLAALVPSACSSETALLVEIESDLAVPGVVDQLDVQAVGSGSGQMLNRRFVLESAFPHSFALRPGDDDAEEVTVTVRARKRATPAMAVGEFVTERAVVARFVAGEVRTVRVVLEAACVGVMCPPGQSCVGGTCTILLPDGGVDAGSDGGRIEAGVDAGRDAGMTDGGRDTGPRDGGPDAGLCSGMCEGRETCGADGCVDTNADIRHCGSCTRACAAGCFRGACATCPTGYLLCGFTCVHATDVRHCGGCTGGVRCAPNQICSGGACRTAGVGQSCGTPDDIGSSPGMFTFDLDTDLLTHLRPSCLSDYPKDARVVRWTAPSSGTFRFTAQYFASGMGPVSGGIQLYAGADGSCSCPLPGTCSGANVRDPVVSVSRSMTAGESILILLVTGRQTVALTQLTIE